MAVADRLTGFAADGPPPPEAEERAELERRVEAFHEGTDPGRPWEQTRSRMRSLIESLSAPKTHRPRGPADDRSYSEPD